jgi:hypothetical protein
VAILVADLDVRVVDEHGEVIRQLTLDPNRDYYRGVRRSGSKGPGVCYHGCYHADQFRADYASGPT